MRRQKKETLNEYKHREDLRRRFIKTETTLFRLRLESDDVVEKEQFLKTLDLDWEPVSGKSASHSVVIVVNMAPFVLIRYQMKKSRNIEKSL